MEPGFFGNSKPALPTDHPFRNVHPGWYWSRTSAARNTGYAWAVQMAGGRVFFEDKIRYVLAWPCRGQGRALPTPDPLGEDSTSAGDGYPSSAERRQTARAGERFDLRDGHVCDRATGLIWSRCADHCGGAVDWPSALRSTRRLDDRQAGADGWRVPSIPELESLLDMRHCDPSLPDSHPFEAVGSGYWSSTSSAMEPDWAMVLHLARGAIGVGVKREPRYLVWPVCGPLWRFSVTSTNHPRWLRPKLRQKSDHCSCGISYW